MFQKIKQMIPLKIKLKILDIKGNLYTKRPDVYFYTRKLVALKKCCPGQRCFIVGNGPSLTIEDLEKIKNEFCFAANRIYTLYDKTEWRPAVFCVQDTNVLNCISKDLEYIIDQSKYVCISAKTIKKIPLKLRSKKNLFFFKLDVNNPYPQLPQFSENPVKKIYEGYTVTYAAIQLAVYMGFKEIYLLGVDHSYSMERTERGEIIKGTGEKDYSDAITAINFLQGNYPQLHKSTLAYERARQYCESHDIVIKNATRGGKLEVFSRINLEDVL